MFFGALRFVIRPVSRTILSPRSPFIFPIASSPSPTCDSFPCHHLLSPFLGNVGGIPASSAFHSARRRNEKNRIKPQDRPFSLSEIKKRKVMRRDAHERREKYLVGKHWCEIYGIVREYAKKSKRDPAVAAMSLEDYMKLKGWYSGKTKSVGASKQT